MTSAPNDIRCKSTPKIVTIKPATQERINQLYSLLEGRFVVPQPPASTDFAKMQARLRGG